MPHRPTAAPELLAPTARQAVEPARSSQMAFEGTGDARLAGWGGHSTPEADELYAATIATDPDERQTTLHQASREAAESVPELVPLSPQVPCITAEHVVDFTPSPSSKPELRSVAVTAR